MNKLRKRDVFAMLDRDCVNPQTRELIKEYIDRILPKTHVAQPVPRKGVKHHERA